MSETVIRLAARLYEARDCAKTLLGEKYEGMLREHMLIITTEQQRTGSSEIGAATEIIKGLVARGSNGVTDLIILATVVEMVEGILALPKIGTVVSYRSANVQRPGFFFEGTALVRGHITSEGRPQHLRGRERMIFVRGMTGDGAGITFLITESDIVK